MEKTPIELLSDRIRYYLLDWKDNNTKLYFSLYQDHSLHDLTVTQLFTLFNYATNQDLKAIH